MVFNGSCNTQSFKAWGAQFLIKALNPGQVVIMDNVHLINLKEPKNELNLLGLGLFFYHLIHLI
ncbi:hypothetical protein P618_200766 [Holospora obtusa F1]|uniref:Uncharacterized protein n=1 Tax=Holospora obtusa F1 TaxID=1399147 RepID=W6TTE5_HOLOB|nr:hypothetical protein [Holospora obtusa]ETZ07057.1 hypothetical protein P618_200766 [Holospora obtusa F1]